MQLTPDELSLDRINEALERGEDVVIKARKKVDPMWGPHYLQGDGLMREAVSFFARDYADMGLAFNTREQAEIANPIIRRVGRYLNWVLANCPGHDPSGEGYYIYMNSSNECKYAYNANVSSLIITMPEHKAKELCELLNSGAYTL